VVGDTTVSASPLALAADVKPEDAAQKAAEAWLALVDAGKYGESWEEAATYFKGAVTKDQWVSGYFIK
jgi:hypothetical protein